jgi:hypothetical protein
MLRNRKSPGEDTITSEMLKYEGDMLIKETIKMTKQTFLTGIIPEE